jgi:hypothetical protein
MCKPSAWKGALSRFQRPTTKNAKNQLEQFMGRRAYKVAMQQFKPGIGHRPIAHLHKVSISQAGISAATEAPENSASYSREVAMHAEWLLLPALIVSGGAEGSGVLWASDFWHENQRKSMNWRHILPEADP